VGADGWLDDGAGTVPHDFDVPAIEGGFADFGFAMLLLKEFDNFLNDGID
jgi:hypothetical protein